MKTAHNKQLGILENFFLITSLVLPLVLIILILNKYDGVSSCWLPMFIDEAIPENLLASKIALSARCSIFHLFEVFGILSIYGFLLSALFGQKRRDCIILVITSLLIITNTVLIEFIYENNLFSIVMAPLWFVGSAFVYLLASNIRLQKGKKISTLAQILMINVIVLLTILITRPFVLEKDKEVILKDIKRIPNWQLFVDTEKRFAFQYPGAEVTTSQDDSGTITIFPHKTPVDDTPLPYMTLQITRNENLISNFDDDFIGFETITPINGVLGEKIIDLRTREAIAVVLQHKNTFYHFSLWESLEWEPFLKTVESFAVLE